MKYIFIFIFSINSVQLYAQSSVIQGKINYDYHGGSDYFPIKLYIMGNRDEDSTTIDSSLKFRFKNVPIGTYQIKVSSLHDKTGLQNIVITDVPVDDRIVNIYPITLFPTYTCESSPVILGKRSGMEYYKSGELYTQGNYKRTYKFFVQGHFLISYYKKTGIWNYYTKDKIIYKKCIYQDNDLKHFTEYYPNNQIKLEGSYSYGCKTGEWRYNSIDGKIIFIVNFDNLLSPKISYKYLKDYIAHYLDTIQ